MSAGEYFLLRLRWWLEPDPIGQKGALVMILRRAEELERLERSAQLEQEERVLYDRG